MASARRNPWPSALIAFATLFAAFTGWSLYRAAAGVSGVTDPAYYVHGLHHGAVLDGERTAAELGWRLDPEIRSGVLRVRLSDGRGRAVSGARVRFAFLSRQGGVESERQLAEDSPGVYAASLPAGLPRGAPGRVEAVLGAARLARPVLLFP